jgi:hypothetical protein
MITPGSSFEDFYRNLQRSIEGNNHVYKVKVTLYDGANELNLIFDSPEGFQADQKQRRGTLEIKTD